MRPMRGSRRTSSSSSPSWILYFSSHRLLSYQTLLLTSPKYRNCKEHQAALYHSTSLYRHALVVFLLQFDSTRVRNFAKIFDESLAPVRSLFDKGKRQIENLGRRFLDPYWSWKLHHEPFARLGNDTIVIVAPEGLQFCTCDLDIITEIANRREDFCKPVESYVYLDL